MTYPVTVDREGKLGIDFVLQVLNCGCMVDFEVDHVSHVWMRNVHSNMPRLNQIQLVMIFFKISF